MTDFELDDDIKIDPAKIDWLSLEEYEEGLGE